MKDKPGLPSGKRLHNYGKSPCSMANSTMSTAIFNSKVKTFTRGYTNRIEPRGLSHAASPRRPQPSSQSPGPNASTGWHRWQEKLRFGEKLISISK